MGAWVPNQIRGIHPRILHFPKKDLSVRTCQACHIPKPARALHQAYSRWGHLARNLTRAQGVAGAQKVHSCSKSGVRHNRELPMIGAVTGHVRSWMQGETFSRKLPQNEPIKIFSRAETFSCAEASFSVEPPPQPPPTTTPNHQISGGCSPFGCFLPLESSKQSCVFRAQAFGFPRGQQLQPAWRVPSLAADNPWRAAARRGLQSRIESECGKPRDGVGSLRASRKNHINDMSFSPFYSHSWLPTFQPIGWVTTKPI